MLISFILSSLQIRTLRAKELEGSVRVTWSGSDYNDILDQIQHLVPIYSQQNSTFGIFLPQCDSGITKVTPFLASGYILINLSQSMHADLLAIDPVVST